MFHIHTLEMRHAVHVTLIWLTPLGRCVPLFHAKYHRCRICAGDDSVNLWRTVTDTDSVASLSRHYCVNRHETVVAVTDPQPSMVSSCLMLQ